jgi:hypothetical protein
VRLEKPSKCEWIEHPKRYLACNLVAAATEQPEERSIDLLMKRNKAGRFLLQS